MGNVKGEFQSRTVKKNSYAKHYVPVKNTKISSGIVVTGMPDKALTQEWEGQLNFVWEQSLKRGQEMDLR